MSCTNCGAEMVDVFCAKCGEKQPDHHDYKLSHVAHHAFHELVHLDSKLFTTLKLLMVRPGFLTKEYFEGRKTRYIAPLRLFLTLFALQLIAYTVYKPVAVYSLEGAKMAGGESTQVDFITGNVAKKKNITPAEASERVSAKWQKNISLFQLFNILLLGIVFKILHRKRYYAEHLVFAAHYLSFTYLLSLLIWPIYATFGLSRMRIPMMIVSSVIMCVYMYLAFRRFYDATKGKAVVKTILGYAGVYVMSVVIMGIAMGVALVQVMTG